MGAAVVVVFYGVCFTRTITLRPYIVHTLSRSYVECVAAAVAAAEFKVLSQVTLGSAMCTHKIDKS